MAKGDKVGGSQANKAKNASSGTRERRKEFAEDVRESMLKAPTAFQGDDRGPGGKRFVSDVYDEFRKANPGVTLEQFKDRLLELNRAGKVELSRLDLVEAFEVPNPRFVPLAPGESRPFSDPTAFRKVIDPRVARSQIRVPSPFDAGRTLAEFNFIRFPR